MEEEPMVIMHTGVEEEVEAMEEKPMPDPAPSTPLPPASPANSSATESSTIAVSLEPRPSIVTPRSPIRLSGKHSYMLNLDADPAFPFF